MKFITQIEQYKRLHKLVEQADTGTPEMLANRLRISRSQLYMFLDTMKDLGAPVRYSRSLQSYYYTTFFELVIDVNIKAITSKESISIYGGNLIKKPSSILFIGRNNPNFQMQRSTTLQVKLTT